MDQDNELLRALIEKRQQMLARMREQIITEHQGLDEKLESLLAALFNQNLFGGNTPLKP
jgi:predicted ArsR family transcriptional regulator